jgi:hypothetical protein
VAIRVNGQRVAGTFGIIVNGVELAVEAGSGSGAAFYNTTADPPDITPGEPDNLREAFSAVLPQHFVDDQPDVPSSTVRTTLLSTGMSVHAVDEVPSDIPLPTVDVLTFALPISVVYHLDDSPVETVDSLASSLPTPLV